MQQGPVLTLQVQKEMYDLFYIAVIILTKDEKGKMPTYLTYKVRV